MLRKLRVRPPESDPFVLGKLVVTITAAALLSTGCSAPASDDEGASTEAAASTAESADSKWAFVVVRAEVPEALAAQHFSLHVSGKPNFMVNASLIPDDNRSYLYMGDTSWMWEDTLTPRWDAEIFHRVPRKALEAGTMSWMLHNTSLFTDSLWVQCHMRIAEAAFSGKEQRVRCKGQPFSDRSEPVRDSDPEFVLWYRLEPRPE